jgi:hypothetical protein
VERYDGDLVALQENEMQAVGESELSDLPFIIPEFLRGKK